MIWDGWLSSAVVDLRMALADLMRITPAQFYGMHRRYSQRSRELEWRNAVLVASVINSGFNRPKEGVDPRDLMSADPYSAEAPIRAPRKRATRKGRDAVASGLRALLNGLMKGAQSATGE